VETYPRNRRGGGLAIVAALLCLPLAGLTPSATAVTLPADPQDLDSLVTEADELGEEYRGDLRDMEGVLEEAEEAEERLEETEDALEEVRGDAALLAAEVYRSNGVDPVLSVFTASDPDALIDRARYVDHLSHSHSETMERLHEVADEHAAAHEEAQAALEEADEDLSELRERREDVQELIADHPEQEMGPPDSLTPRTRQMRDLVLEEFGEGPGYGCYRPHDGSSFVGEHPKGRACDFMMSNDGRMPPQDEIDRGWDIAEWSKDNADRLGIMYVIYRQQIWDQRRGDTDWRPMGDRGSITENHFDHVHISMW
jgi:peptidoglycan DL-endopeptidase CwlO